MPDIKGVGPDQPVVVNELGAGQSASPYRFDLLPPMASASIAEILAHGATKYGEGSYLNIPAKDHLNHAMQHIFAHQAGDTQEGDVIEHAKHAVCRAMFWLECLEREFKNPEGSKEEAAHNPSVVRVGQTWIGNTSGNLAVIKTLGSRVVIEGVKYPWCRILGSIPWDAISTIEKNYKLLHRAVLADGTPHIDSEWVNKATREIVTVTSVKPLESGHVATFDELDDIVIGYGIDSVTKYLIYCGKSAYTDNCFFELFEPVL